MSLQINLTEKHCRPEKAIQSPSVSKSSPHKDSHGYRGGGIRSARGSEGRKWTGIQAQERGSKKTTPNP